VRGARSRGCEFELDMKEKLQLMTLAKARLRTIRKIMFAELMDEIVLLSEVEEVACNDQPPAYSSLFGS
jgi:hypothetical protein